MGEKKENKPKFCIDHQWLMMGVSFLSFLIVYIIYLYDNNGYYLLTDAGIPLSAILFYPVYMLPVVAEFIEYFEVFSDEW